MARRPPVKSIDGVQVDSLEPGKVYELGTSIAAVLMAEGWAVPVPIDEPAPHEPFSQTDPYGAAPFQDPDAPPNLTREHYPPFLEQPRSIAAEVERRTRKRPR